MRRYVLDWDTLDRSNDLQGDGHVTKKGITKLALCYVYYLLCELYCYLTHHSDCGFISFKKR